MNKDHEKYIPLSTVKGRSKVENLHGHIAINKANIPSTWKRTQATSAISGFILPTIKQGRGFALTLGYFCYTGTGDLQKLI